jgi:hypothetical protein
MDVPGSGHDRAAGGRGGAALLAIAASASATQIAETLLASGGGWRVARPVDGALDRLALKRAVDELHAAAPAIALIVVAAPLAMIAGAPAVLLADLADRYPDDASLPLAWLGERLQAVTAPTVVVLAAPTWPEASVVTAGLAALAPGDPLVVVAAPADEALASLAAALAGAALDPATGTITLASLGRYLGATLGESQVRPTARVATVLCPPPVAPTLELLRSRRSGAAAAAHSPTTSVGTVLPGRFRLDEELARGSFGAVYRARQLAVDRDVAIKLLHDDLDPTSADGRLFLHEIRAVGRLDHPNVVRIYQADVSHDGRLFYAMELLRGATLAALCADGPLPAPRALALVGQLVAGLAAAHEAGLVHADVKPANAMVVEARGGGERLVLLDFGLARLRQAEPATSAGGTPAFMAPEQLRDGRVDARSDVFAVGLVLVALLTGWRRRSARELVPPLDGIAEPHLRAVLARALALEPGERYPSAVELAAALAREAAPPLPPRPPFVRLASLTEADAERLCGRDRERALLVDHVLFRSAVVVTAPSGVGKTSLLRAGLIPRLGQLGVIAGYASGRAAPVATLIEALAAGAPDLASALAARSGAARVVVVIDQVEALFLDDGADLAAVLALVRAPPPEVAVVLSVREDFLARLLDRPELVGAPAPVVRIGPLTRDAAEQALRSPLAERRLEAEPALVDAVLDDLVAAAAAMAPELGWGSAPAVFPPHLQLVGAALYDALPADAHRLTLAHYHDLGGFAAVVGEHLERVLETELTAPQATIARELFVALVTTASARAIRDEAELIALAGAAPAAVVAVLEVLRAQGLVAPVRGDRAALGAGPRQPGAAGPGLARSPRPGAAPGPSSRSATTCGAPAAAPSACCRGPSCATSSATPAPSPNSTPSTPAGAATTSARPSWWRARGGGPAGARWPRRRWPSPSPRASARPPTIAGPSPPTPTASAPAPSATSGASPSSSPPSTGIRPSRCPRPRAVGPVRSPPPSCPRSTSRSTIPTRATLTPRGRRAPRPAPPSVRFPDIRGATPSRPRGARPTCPSTAATGPASRGAGRRSSRSGPCRGTPRAAARPRPSRSRCRPVRRPWPARSRSRPGRSSRAVRGSRRRNACSRTRRPPRSVSPTSPPSRSTAPR